MHAFFSIYIEYSKKKREDFGILEDYQRNLGNRIQGNCQGNRKEYQVAMAYVPWQYWTRLYDLERGFCEGTIFQELNKPFLGVRGGCR